MYQKYKILLLANKEIAILLQYHSNYFFFKTEMDNWHLIYDEFCIFYSFKNNRKKGASKFRWLRNTVLED